MNDPWQRIKQLPWLTLVQAAGLTAIVAILLEIILAFSFQIRTLAMVFAILFSGVLGPITALGAAIGLGAIAVLILERINRFSISVASLWALVLCLALAIGLVQFIGLLAIGVVGLSYIQAVGFTLGIFWKGRPYWKHYRRW